MSTHNIQFNTLPHMQILGSSSSSANKDMMTKILTNGDAIICLSENIMGKGEIARAISAFPTMFLKAVCC